MLIHFWYGASDKVAFLLCNDKFDFMLLLGLVIDLMSILKAWNQLKVMWYHQKSRTIFDSPLSINLDN